jgi:hypothetical protein
MISSTNIIPLSMFFFPQENGTKALWELATSTSYNLFHMKHKHLYIGQWISLPIPLVILLGNSLFGRFRNFYDSFVLHKRF